MYSPRSKTPKGKEREQSRPQSRLVNRLSRRIEYTPPASPNIKPESLPPLPDSIPPSPALSSREPQHLASPALSTASIASRPQDRASVKSTAQSATVEDYESDAERSVETKASHDTTKASPSRDKVETELLTSQPGPSTTEGVPDDTAKSSEPEIIPSASEIATKEPGPTATETPKPEQKSEQQSSPAETNSATQLASTSDPALESTATGVQSPKAPPSVPEGPRSPSVLSQHLPRASYPSSLIDPYTPQSVPGYPSGYWHPNMSFTHGYPMIPQHGTPHYQPSYNNFSAPFAPYSSSPPLPRQNSMGSRGSNAGDFAAMPGAQPPGSMGTNTANGTAIDDDAGDLLTRISAAIPDLHLLLNRYKETHGQLGLREELIRQAEAAQADALKRKEDYIDNLTRQLESATKQHAAESSKLRLEIGNLEEKSKELEERIGEAERSKAEMEKVKGELETQKEAVEKEKLELERSTKEEKERLLGEFEEWKKSADETFQAEKMALAVEFDRLQKEKADADEADRAAVAEEHEKEKQRFEDGFANIRKELEDNLTDVKKELDDALEKQRQNSEAWDAQRQTLTKSLDEQRDLLTDQHSREKEELEKKTAAEKDALTAERDKLQKDRDEERTKFQSVIEEMKGVAGNFGAERDRMQKIIDGFGEIVDLKSKGDAHYTEAFSKLLTQILNLSHTHFKHLSTRPPDSHLSLIPSSLPSFLGNTAATHHLRAAYITHLVSSHLTAHIFTPFLFSLDPVSEPATDAILASMSTQLRIKNPRKEALWRQQTLTTLFTGADAKRRINATASGIVEDIVAAIKPFAEPSEEEGIRTTVRRIVKLAAETWRFARLERELITATMPTVGASSEEDSKEGFWLPQTFDAAEFPHSGSPAMSAVVSSIGPLDDKEGESTDRKALLRLFPVIRRESRQKDWREDKSGEEDQGCVYSHGLALYDDAPPVVSRLRGLRHAGLTGPITSLDQKLRAPLASPKVPETPATPAETAVSSTGSRAISRTPLRTSSRASTRKRATAPEEVVISRKDSIINPESVKEQEVKSADTKQTETENEDKTTKAGGKSNEPAPPATEMKEKGSETVQEKTQASDDSTAPLTAEKDQFPEATTGDNEEPAKEVSGPKSATKADPSAIVEAANGDDGPEKKREASSSGVIAKEDADSKTEPDHPEDAEKDPERVRYLAVPRKIGSTPATVRPPSGASTTTGEEPAEKASSKIEPPAKEASKVDEKANEEKNKEAPKDEGKQNKAEEPKFEAANEATKSKDESAEDEAKENPRTESAAPGASDDADDAKAEEKKTTLPMSSKTPSVKSKRSVRSSSRAPTASRPATPSAALPVPLSEKASSEKAPSEKAPSEKAPSEKASSEKAHSEKVPSEKVPSEKVPQAKGPSEKAKSIRSSHSRSATPREPVPETSKLDEAQAPKYRIRSTPVDQRTASLRYTSEPATTATTASSSGSTSSRLASPSSRTEASPGPAPTVPPILCRSGSLPRRGSTTNHGHSHSQPQADNTNVNSTNIRSMAFEIPAHHSRSSSRHTTGSSGDNSVRVSVGSRGTVTDTRSAAVKGLYLPGVEGAGYAG